MLELMIIIIEDFMKSKTKDNNENLLDKKKFTIFKREYIF